MDPFIWSIKLINLLETLNTLILIILLYFTVLSYILYDFLFRWWYIFVRKMRKSKRSLSKIDSVTWLTLCRLLIVKSSNFCKTLFSNRFSASKGTCPNTVSTIFTFSIRIEHEGFLSFHWSNIHIVMNQIYMYIFWRSITFRITSIIARAKYQRKSSTQKFATHHTEGKKNLTWQKRIINTITNSIMDTSSILSYDNFVR